MNVKQKLIQKENDTPHIRLSRNKRIIIFICFFVLYVLNNSDEGIISAGSNQIKEELNINDTLFGLYSSIDHLGRIIGTISVFILLDLFDRKYLIFFVIILKCATLIIYFKTSNYLIIMLFRFLQGFLHVFTYVYFPTWADQFGFQNSKTKISLLIQFSFPFGSVLGFVATAFLGDYKNGFVLLTFRLLLLNFILLFMPDNFFFLKYFFIRQ